MICENKYYLEFTVQHYFTKHYNLYNCLFMYQQFELIYYNVSVTAIQVYSILYRFFFEKSPSVVNSQTNYNFPF